MSSIVGAPRSQMCFRGARRGKEFDRPGRYLSIFYPQLRPTDSRLPLPPPCPHHHTPHAPDPDRGGPSSLSRARRSRLKWCSVGALTTQTARVAPGGSFSRSVCVGTEGVHPPRVICHRRTINAFPQEPTARSRKRHTNLSHLGDK